MMTNMLSRIGSSQYAASDATTSAANGVSTTSMRPPAWASASYVRPPSASVTSPAPITVAAIDNDVAATVNPRTAARRS